MDLVFHDHFKVFLYPRQILKYNFIPQDCDRYDVDEFFMSVHKKIRNTLIKNFEQDIRTLVLKWCLVLKILLIEPDYKTRGNKKKGGIWVFTLKSKNFKSIYPTVQGRYPVLIYTLQKQVQEAFSSLHREIYDKTQSTSFLHIERILSLQIDCIDYSGEFKV